MSALQYPAGSRDEEIQLALLAARSQVIGLEPQTALESIDAALNALSPAEPDQPAEDDSAVSAAAVPAVDPANEREPTHICLDCGALGYAGGYHDHGDGNAGGTLSIAALLSEYRRVCADNDELTDRLAEPVQATDPVRAAMRLQDGVQALLGVLNDIGGGNPWNYNVITEAAEDALDAALEAMGTALAADREPKVERVVTTPHDDPIVQACVDNGGHFWPEDAPEDEPPTCTRCWFNPGWKSGKPRNEANIRPVRDEPQA